MLVALVSQSAVFSSCKTRKSKHHCLISETAVESCNRETSFVTKKEMRRQSQCRDIHTCILSFRPFRWSKKKEPEKRRVVGDDRLKCGLFLLRNEKDRQSRVDEEVVAKKDFSFLRWMNGPLFFVILVQNNQRSNRRRRRRGKKKTVHSRRWEEEIVSSLEDDDTGRL